MIFRQAAIISFGSLTYNFMSITLWDANNTSLRAISNKPEYFEGKPLHLGYLKGKWHYQNGSLEGSVNYTKELNGGRTHRELIEGEARVLVVRDKWTRLKMRGARVLARGGEYMMKGKIVLSDRFVEGSLQAGGDV